MNEFSQTFVFSVVKNKWKKPLKYKSIECLFNTSHGIYFLNTKNFTQTVFLVFFFAFVLPKFCLKVYMKVVSPTLKANRNNKLRKICRNTCQWGSKYITKRLIEGQNLCVMGLSICRTLMQINFTPEHSDKN
jgi:hypothetical protein